MTDLSRLESGSSVQGVHGGPSGGIEDALVRIDFSVSLNAFGPAPAVLEAIRNAVVDTYPDPTSRAVREVAAGKWGIHVDTISFGAGTSELLYAAAYALLDASSRVVIPAPTFGDYERVARLAGADIYHVPAMDIEVHRFITEIERLEPALVFLCNPNNPTGYTVEADDLRIIADACQKSGSLLVLDQSYDSFLEKPLGVAVLRDHPSVIHLHSITKDHSLAGVRAGFLVASADIVRRIERVRAPWSASAIAQAAAISALGKEGDEHLAKTIPVLRSEKERLKAAVSEMGFEVLSGQTHTILVNVGDAKRFCRELLYKKGLRVRDCSSFELPEYIRIAARTESDNSELINAFREMRKEGQI